MAENPLIANSKFLSEQTYRKVSPQDEPQPISPQQDELLGKILETIPENSRNPWIRSYALPAVYGQQEPLPFNPNYGLLQRRSGDENGRLYHDASLVNDISTRIFHKLGMGNITFGDDTESTTAKDFFAIPGNKETILGQPYGEAIWRKYLKGDYDGPTTYNDLMNNFSYDLARERSKQSLSEASGLVKWSATIAAGIGDPATFALTYGIPIPTSMSGLKTAITTGASVPGVRLGISGIPIVGLSKSGSVTRNVGALAAQNLGENVLAQAFTEGVRGTLGGEAQDLEGNVLDILTGTVMSSAFSGLTNFGNIRRAAKVNKFLEGLQSEIPVSKELRDSIVSKNYMESVLRNIDESGETVAELYRIVLNRVEKGETPPNIQVDISRNNRFLVLTQEGFDERVIPISDAIDELTKIDMETDDFGNLIRTEAYSRKIDFTKLENQNKIRKHRDAKFDKILRDTPELTADQANARLEDELVNEFLRKNSGTATFVYDKNTNKFRASRKYTGFDGLEVEDSIEFSALDATDITQELVNLRTQLFQDIDNFARSMGGSTESKFGPATYSFGDGTILRGVSPDMKNLDEYIPLILDMSPGGTTFVPQVRNIMNKYLELKFLDYVQRNNLEHFTMNFTEYLPLAGESRNKAGSKLLRTTEYNDVFQKLITGEKITDDMFSALVTDSSKVADIFNGKVSADALAGAIGDADASVGILSFFKEALLKTAYQSAFAKSANPITFAKNLWETIYEDLGEKVGWVNKRANRRGKQVIRQENIGLIDGSEAVQIIKDEKLSGPIFKQFLWNAIPVVAGIYFGLPQIKNYFFTDKSTKTEDLAAGNLGLGYKAALDNMSPEEAQSMMTSIKMVLQDPNMFIFTSTVIEELAKLPSPLSTEIEKLKQILDTSGGKLDPVQTMLFNKRVLNLLETTYGADTKISAKEYRDTIDSMKYSGYMDIIDNRYEEVAENFIPTMSKFRFLDSVEKSAISSAIENSLSNGYRKNISSYSRQVKSWLEEIKSRLTPEQARSFDMVSKPLTKKLTGINNRLLSGIDENGQGYSANFVIQSVGSAMLAVLKEDEVTDSILESYVSKYADKTDTYEYLISIGLSNLSMNKPEINGKYYGAHVPSDPRKMVELSKILNKYPVIAEKINNGTADENDLAFAHRSGPLNLLFASQNIVRVTA